MSGRHYGLVKPDDQPSRQIEKLEQICQALMNRVEQAGDPGSGRVAYDQFQHSVMLQDQVRQRTRDLERALDLLNISNASLAEAHAETERARSDLVNAIETILDGFALFDRDERLVLYNSRFCLQLRDVRAALRPGLSFSDYVATVARSTDLGLPPDVTPQVWAQERLARHAEEHVMFNVRIAGDRWIQVSEHRTADLRTVIMQTDVSDILNAEREEHGRRLDDHAALTRATLEHMAQGVGVFDGRNRLVHFNRRLATMLSIPLNRLRAGLDAETVMGWMQASTSRLEGASPTDVSDWLRQENNRQQLRFSFRRGAGQWFDFLAREMTQGGIVVSVTDVSAERAAAAQLSEANLALERRVVARTLELQDALRRAERANAARSRFVAAASHDLLQPLSAAKLYLSSVSGELPSGAHRQIVDKAQNALLSVQEIIGALLDISRLESESFVPDLQAVDLTRLFEKLNSDFTPAARAAGIGLRFRPLPVRVLSDPTYLRRILQNLIANAIRYTGKGHVLVGARRQGGAIRIGVWDTGPGIPESEQANVFTEFYRLGRRASASEGLGLGLAIVERACATLGHELRLASRVGHGTGVTLTAQLAAPPLAAALPLAEAAGHGAPNRWRHDGLAALVIENDRDFRSALTVLLQGWGVRVFGAATVAGAIRACDRAHSRPSIALIDYRLDNGTTALDALDQLKAAGFEVDFIIMTADRSDAAAIELGHLGSRLLHKPIDPLSLHLFLTSAKTGT